jgi:hypothetical protein
VELSVGGRDLCQKKRQIKRHVYINNERLPSDFAGAAYGSHAPTGCKAKTRIRRSTNQRGASSCGEKHGKAQGKPHEKAHGQAQGKGPWENPLERPMRKARNLRNIFKQRNTVLIIQKEVKE